MAYFKAQSKDIRTIPDIETITRTLGVGRIELVTLAAEVSRSKNIRATEALELLGSGELDIAEIKEQIIQKLQTVKPPVEEIVEPDDTPSLPQ